MRVDKVEKVEKEGGEEFKWLRRIEVQARDRQANLPTYSRAENKKQTVADNARNNDTFIPTKYFNSHIINAG